MNKKSLLLTLVVFGLLVAGMFVFAYLANDTSAQTTVFNYNLSNA